LSNKLLPIVSADCAKTTTRQTTADSICEKTWNAIASRMLAMIDDMIDGLLPVLIPGRWFPSTSKGARSRKTHLPAMMPPAPMMTPYVAIPVFKSSGLNVIDKLLLPLPLCGINRNCGWMAAVCCLFANLLIHVGSRTVNAEATARQESSTNVRRGSINYSAGQTRRNGLKDFIVLVQNSKLSIQFA
jgi:hypothetical protein